MTKLENVNVLLKKLSSKAVIPEYAHINKETGENEGDVGLDLTAISVEYDEEKDAYIYHTGIVLQTDKGYGALIFPRSSNRNTNCYLANSVGIIDTTIYRGEIIVTFKPRTSSREFAINNSNSAFISYLSNTLSSDKFAFFKIGKVLREACEIKNKIYNETLEKVKNLEYAPYNVGDRIAQMVVVKYPYVSFSEKDKLSKTSRGTGGHGSTNTAKKK